MERKQLHRLIASKLTEYSQGVPEDLREEFVQDMWITLLGIEEKLQNEERVGPASGVASLLNLTLFRARWTWLEAQHYRQRKEEALFESASGQEPSLDVAADVRLEAQDAIRDIITTLRASALTEDEVVIVIAGLRDGLTLAEIAACLGKTPQAFHHYVKRLRAA